MTSKRGRKRNDNLPPNRARDVQRAFRARRAAHLQALEQRVAELEDENAALRAALNLPPANRVPLGKGPTGKDKPNKLSSTLGAHQGSPHESSAPDTPSSGNSSRSPSARHEDSRNSRVDALPWEPSLLSQPTDGTQPHLSSSVPYLPPTNPSISQKSLPSYTYHDSLMGTGSRTSTSPLYLGSPSAAEYPSSTARPLGHVFTTYDLRDSRDEASQSRYPSYTQSSYSTTQDCGVHSQHCSLRETDTILPSQRRGQVPETPYRFPANVGLSTSIRSPPPSRQSDGSFLPLNPSQNSATGRLL